ncbi:type VII secretion protein EccB [Actinoplanes sp. TBRC 11911]|uniref:type VII secretion protein EccB n=1 Tax=Actinoplanes sp. TBRC 11911 TaxID=2729386 RepID=UPI00145C9B51|nr:type VII secretion protein EccB [Actinoplanes sp. TBRC 11911]NMO56940.1 type VII secretion protein EccB [Actinoplanes sp. TBRC 11911]
MQTQRDHVHAHQFMMGRLSSALVQGDPTSAEIPGHRALTGLLFGILVAVLGIGGVAVYGWIVPGGSNAYTKPGTMLVEKETGNRYVYVGGAVHPVANVTTASLLLGGAMTVKLISRNSLKDVPHGNELGDIRWPQSVAASTPVAGPWMVCLPGSRVKEPSPTALGVNLSPSAPSAPLATDRFTVVRSPGGTDYLINQGHKYAVRDDSVLVALGAGNAPAVLAPQLWLDWLPSGTELKPAVIAHAGADGPSIGGENYPVGTLFEQKDQLFVLLRDGLAPIGATDFLLAASKHDTPPVSLDAADVAAAPKSDDKTLAKRLPDFTEMHWQDPGDAVLCQRQAPKDENTFQTMVVYTTAEQSGVDGKGGAHVVAAPGTGMAVVAVPHAKTAHPAITFISESGMAYPVADQKTQSALGLDRAPAPPFPKSLLSTLDTGPTLSQAAVTGPTGG